MIPADPGGVTAPKTLLQRLVRSVAYRAVARLNSAEAAELTLDLIVSRDVSKNFTDRQIALLARALASDDYVASRVAARTLIASAPRDGADPAPGAVDSPEIAEGLASALSTRTTFVRLLFEHLPAQTLATALIDQLVARDLSNTFPGESQDKLAAYFGSKPDFATKIIASADDLTSNAEQIIRLALQKTAPREAASDAAMKQLIEQRLLEDLPPARIDLALRIILGDQSGLDAIDRVTEHLVPPTIKRIVSALAEARRDLLEEQLNAALPDHRHRAESYSQEGEDLVVARIFDGQKSGFYVDVGAMHPIRFSNTYLFYKRGWRGVNVDATPGAMEEFNRLRPEDTNIECMVSSDTTAREYFLFDEPALNTSSQELAQSRAQENAAYQVVRKVTRQPRTLADLLSTHVPSGQHIDLMSVDVEGADLDVLQSNDWSRFRPTLIVAELLHTALSELDGHEIAAYLRTQRYVPVAKQHNSVVFAQLPGQK